MKRNKMSFGSKLVILPTEEYENYYKGRNIFMNKNFEEDDIVYILKNDCEKIVMDNIEFLIALHYNIFMCEKLSKRREEFTTKNKVVFDDIKII